MAPSENTHKAVEKALKILVQFTPHNRPLGTIELSRRLDMHKSTVSRLLQVLVRFDFLTRDPRTQKFSLGKSAADLGSALSLSHDAALISIARPYIRKLRDQLQETVVLEALSGASTVLLYAATGPGPVYVREAAGERRPVHASAGGKLLLAYAPLEIRARYLDVGLPKVTSGTVTEVARRNVQFDTICKQGFAVDNEEVHIGIRAVAAPVFDRRQAAVAAVVVTGMAQKISFDESADVVARAKAAAAKISARLYEQEE